MTRRALAYPHLPLLVLLAVAGCKRPRSESKPVSIVVTPEMAASAAGMQAPTVRVRLGPPGAAVSVGGENIGPGCSGKGPGLAVPAKAGQQDFPSLTRCLERLQSTTPSLASQTSLELVADGATAYATVIGAMDAVRKTADGGDLFPDVLISPAERDR